MHYYHLTVCRSYAKWRQSCQVWNLKKIFFEKNETNVLLVIYSKSPHLKIRLTRPTLHWAFIVKLDDQVFDLRSATNPETDPYKSQLRKN